MIKFLYFLRRKLKNRTEPVPLEQIKPKNKTVVVSSDKKESIHSVKGAIRKYFLSPLFLDLMIYIT